MLNDIKKNELTEQEMTKLNETEMEEVAGGWMAPGPLDFLKDANRERKRQSRNEN